MLRWTDYSEVWHERQSHMETVLKKIYRRTFKRIFPSTTDISDAFIANEIKGCSRILDLGIGPHSSISRIKSQLRSNVFILGVEDFKPYTESNRVAGIHNSYLKSNILAIDFPPDSFDCAILIDVIEHIDKQEFLDFLPKLELIAKIIIIVTPNGFLEQNEYDDNPYQIHRSGWTEEELRKLGFLCHGISGLKCLRGKFALPRIRPHIVGNMLCHISERLVWNNPTKAFHLLGVKHTRS